MTRGRRPLPPELLRKDLDVYFGAEEREFITDTLAYYLVRSHRVELERVADVLRFALIRVAARYSASESLPPVKLYVKADRAGHRIHWGVNDNERGFLAALAEQQGMGSVSRTAIALAIWLSDEVIERLTANGESGLRPFRSHRDLILAPDDSRIQSPKSWPQLDATRPSLAQPDRSPAGASATTPQRSVRRLTV